MVVVVSTDAAGGEIHSLSSSCIDHKELQMIRAALPRPDYSGSSPVWVTLTTVTGHMRNNTEPPRVSCISSRTTSRCYPDGYVIAHLQTSTVLTGRKEGWLCPRSTERLSRPSLPDPIAPCCSPSPTWPFWGYQTMFGWLMLRWESDSKESHASRLRRCSFNA